MFLETYLDELTDASSVQTSGFARCGRAVAFPACRLLAGREAAAFLA
jgi:hypothetical protein